MNAAIKAPATAQPIPIPATAPFDKSFEDEDWLALGFEDDDDWLSALAVEEPVMLPEAADVVEEPVMLPEAAFAVADVLVTEAGFEGLVDIPVEPGGVLIPFIRI